MNSLSNVLISKDILESGMYVRLRNNKIYLIIVNNKNDNDYIYGVGLCSCINISKDYDNNLNNLERRDYDIVALYNQEEIAFENAISDPDKYLEKINIK